MVEAEPNLAAALRETSRLLGERHTGPIFEATFEHEHVLVRVDVLKGHSIERDYGIGDNFAAVLAREVFYRHFGNRKQLASYVGLAPTPHQSGNVDKDRRIGRAGNARARKTLVQAAWLWLRYQPGSELAA